MASVWLIAPVEAGITEPIGFSFDIVNDSLPAGLSGLESGMIIDMYNGEKVNGYTDFITNVQNCVKPEDKITFGSGDDNYVITATHQQKDKTKPLIGIDNIKNEVKIKEGWGWLAPIIFRLKSLFKWLFLLNLFIGLANLLPLGIVDGGRMLQISLHKIVNDGKKAHKIWMFIAILFLVLLVFGLLTTYFGNPFGLFG